jgi:hypothetical protein
MNTKLRKRRPAPLLPLHSEEGDVVTGFPPLGTRRRRRAHPRTTPCPMSCAHLKVGLGCISIAILACMGLSRDIWPLVSLLLQQSDTRSDTRGTVFHRVQRHATAWWLRWQLAAPTSNTTLVVFTCANGQKGYLNDDYCDCPDGLDEPATSACAHLLVHQRTFRCIGIDSTEVVLFASRLRDGIRDCADGSDEM